VWGWKYVRTSHFGFDSLLGIIGSSSFFNGSKGKEDEGRFFETQKLRVPKSIEWQTIDKLKNESEQENRLQKCRYTKQGKRWVVDEFGFFCDRYQLTAFGCCRTSPASRFVCTTCDTRLTHCCSTYEHCVSCCLQPSQRPLLETVIKLTNGSRLRALLMVKDQYELCEWKCRTSSNSVYQENKYKSPKTKYCYGPEPKLPYTR